MYVNLDMPVDVFHKVIETNSFEPLFNRKKVVKIRHIHAQRVHKTIASYMWDRINNLFIEAFGVSKEFESIYYKQRDILNLELASILGDTSANFLINEYKQHLNQLRKDIDQVTDFKKYHVQLHRAIMVKYPGIRTHELTVFEFYTYLSDIMKESEHAKMEVIRTGTDG
jgi:hypothetical protein